VGKNNKKYKDLYISWDICLKMRLKIDEKDRKILDVLMENANYSVRKVAKRTTLPINTVHNRIKKMKNEKVIQKYTIIPDYEQLDKSYFAYVLIDANLPLLQEKKITLDDLAKTIRKFYFVESVFVVGGETDLVIALRVKDSKEFNKVLQNKIQQVTGVLETRELIAIG